MCCVVGFVSECVTEADRLLFAELVSQGAVRGMHAYGLAVSSEPRGLRVRKSLRLKELLEMLRDQVEVGKAVRALAHCRYSTSGDHEEMENNQPIVVGDMALVFNGVISMKSKPEYEQEFGVRCAVDNDGEIFVRKVAAGINPQGFLASTRCSFAGVWINGGRLGAIRNAQRPLWYHRDGWLVSTADIWRRAGGGKGLVELAPNELVGPL